MKTKPRDIMLWNTSLIMDFFFKVMFFLSKSHILLFIKVTKSSSRYRKKCETKVVRKGQFILIKFFDKLNNENSGSKTLSV